MAYLQQTQVEHQQLQISNNPVSSNKNVTEITPLVLRTIREELDTTTGTLNVIDVARQLMYGSKKAFSPEDISAFDRAWAGGGNPAREFWSKLAQRKPNFSVKLMKDIIAKHRIDGFNKALENKQDDLLIFHEKNLMLSRQLESILSIDKDHWKVFAEELDFTKGEINNIASAVRRNNQNSPTESMMNTLMMKCPTMTVLSFMQQLSAMGCENLSLKIGNWLLGRDINDQVDVGGIAQIEDEDNDYIN